MPNHERAEDGALQRPAALRQSGANPHPEAFLKQAMADWGDAVYRLALGQTRSRADAEDVYQDVFLRLLDSGTAFESPEHLKAWLLRVTVNRCRDLARSGWKRRTVALDPEWDAPDAAAHDDATRHRHPAALHANRAHLRTVLDQLHGVAHDTR